MQTRSFAPKGLYGFNRGEKIELKNHFFFPCFVGVARTHILINANLQDRFSLKIDHFHLVSCSQTVWIPSPKMFFSRLIQSQQRATVPWCLFETRLSLRQNKIKAEEHSVCIDIRTAFFLVYIRSEFMKCHFSDVGHQSQNTSILPSSLFNHGPFFPKFNSWYQ